MSHDGWHLKVNKKKLDLIEANFVFGTDKALQIFFLNGPNDSHNLKRQVYSVVDVVLAKEKVYVFCALFQRK